MYVNEGFLNKANKTDPFSEARVAMLDGKSRDLDLKLHHMEQELAELRETVCAAWAGKTPYFCDVSHTNLLRYV